MTSSQTGSVEFEGQSPEGQLILLLHVLISLARALENSLGKALYIAQAKYYNVTTNDACDCVCVCVCQMFVP